MINNYRHEHVLAQYAAANIVQAAIAIDGLASACYGLRTFYSQATLADQLKASVQAALVPLEKRAKEVAQQLGVNLNPAYSQVQSDWADWRVSASPKQPSHYWLTNAGIDLIATEPFEGGFPLDGNSSQPVYQGGIRTRNLQYVVTRVILGRTRTSIVWNAGHGPRVSRLSAAVANLTTLATADDVVGKPLQLAVGSLASDLVSAQASLRSQYEAAILAVAADPFPNGEQIPASVLASYPTGTVKCVYTYDRQTAAPLAF